MDDDRPVQAEPVEAAATLFHYTSADEDSSRWWGFPLREGDIVISTRSKSGTTWMQMICLLLIHQTPKLPSALGALSPWMDWKTFHKEVVWGQLDVQPFRRVIKTHTPLDGVPIEDGVTYIVMGRHPLDVAVSLYHHRDNLDRARIRELIGEPPSEPSSEPPSESEPSSEPPSESEPSSEPEDAADQPHQTVDEWVREFVDWDGDPRQRLDSLSGLMLHLTDAWDRQADADVILVHYDELLEDLDGSMRRLARLLDIEVDELVWPQLVDAATFDAMRAAAAESAPDAGVGVLKDPVAFFRHGVSGDGRRLLDDDEMAHYRERVASLGPSDVVAWLDHEAS